MVRTTWWSRRAMKVHLTALVVIPACAALCVWQVHRALSGNELSWAYVFEWPIFAAYAVFMWWRLLHAETLVSDQEEAERTVAGRAEVAEPSPAPERAEVAEPSPAPEPATIGKGDEPAAATGAKVPGGDPGAGADAEDAELDEYNRYLAALNASGRRKHW